MPADNDKRRLLKIKGIILKNANENKAITAREIIRELGIYDPELLDGDLEILKTQGLNIKTLYYGGQKLYHLVQSDDKMPAFDSALFHNSPSNMIIYDVIGDGATKYDFIIKDINPTALNTERVERSKVIGKPLGEIKPHVDEFGLVSVLQRVWRTGETVNYPAKIYRDDEKNEGRWFENTVYKLPTGEIVAVYWDVTEKMKKEAQVEYLAYRDSLTGLYNRAHMVNEGEKLDREGSLPMGIILFDVDGLKLINDTFGHQSGNKILIKAADAIKECPLITHGAARMGGDEFLVLLPNSDDEKTKRAAEWVVSRFLSQRLFPIQLELSYGYTIKTRREENWNDLYKKAEDYLYRRKLLKRNSYRSDILETLKRALFEKSYETEAHGERIASFSKEIAKELDLSVSQISDLELVSMLHDIGKIAIDGSILNKPAKLTEEERNEINRHPEVGYRIAQSIPALTGISEYILTHHERWDGRGYPRGLKGEEIPLLSRILSIVDAFDAMTNDRPYRKKMSYEKAAEQIIVNAGSQFDPRVADLFIGYLEKNHF